MLFGWSVFGEVTELIPPALGPKQGALGSKVNGARVCVLGKKGREKG